MHKFSEPKTERFGRDFLLDIEICPKKFKKLFQADFRQKYIYRSILLNDLAPKVFTKNILEFDVIFQNFFCLVIVQVT